jgi:hypothetical protein
MLSRPVGLLGTLGAMRKTAVALGLIFTAGACGLVLAGETIVPAAGALAGLCLLAGVVTVVGVKTDDLAFAAVCVLVLTVTWNGIRVGGGALGDVFFALAFAAVLAHVIVDRRAVPLPPWLLLAGIGCFLAGLLSMIFPPSVALVQKSLVTETTFLAQDGVSGLVAPRSNVGLLVEYELSLIMIPVLIVAVGTTASRCAKLVNLWTFGAVINAIVGVADYAGIAHLTPVVIAAHRSAGLTVQANYLALTCVIAIPTAMLWFGRSRLWTIAGLVAVPALLGGVYASGSRDGTVAALLALAATVAVVPRLRPGLRITLPVGGMALLALLLFTKAGSEILKQVRLGSSTSTSLSDYQRSAAASVAWAEIQARPAEGVGFSVIADAHSIYLELLAAGGLIALTSFVIFLGGVFASVRRTIRGTQADLGIALAVALVAWLANGVFDNQLADKYLYVVPGLLLATAYATTNPMPIRTRRTSQVTLDAGLSPPQTLAPTGAP